LKQVGRLISTAHAATAVSDESFLDHVQIMALCTALKINVRIAYLDGRRAGVVDFVDIPEGIQMEGEPLTLLYRWVHTNVRHP
jgi:hypothetical protein